MGLIVSLLVYQWMLKALPAFEDSIGSTFSFVLGMDRRTLFFAVCIGLLTNVIFGLAPALIASGTNLTGALKNQVWLGSRRNRIPWRKALVVIQMVLTVILLIGAGVFIRTVWHFESIDPGFDRNVLLLSSDFILSGGFEIGTADTERQAVTFFHQAPEGVREIPAYDPLHGRQICPMTGEVLSRRRSAPNKVETAEKTGSMFTVIQSARTTSRRWAYRFSKAATSAIRIRMVHTVW